MFNPGDLVVYTPNMPLPPIRERPWDVCTVHSIDEPYVSVTFEPNDRIWQILPEGLRHHPLSPRVIREKMKRVLPEIKGAVEGRVVALAFSEITGQTAQRGFGAADVLRSFLDPRPVRKHRYITMKK